MDTNKYRAAGGQPAPGSLPGRERAGEARGSSGSSRSVLVAVAGVEADEGVAGQREVVGDAPRVEAVLAGLIRAGGELEGLAGGADEDLGGPREGAALRGDEDSPLA